MTMAGRSNLYRRKTTINKRSKVRELKSPLTEYQVQALIKILERSVAEDTSKLNESREQ